MKKYLFILAAAAALAACSKTEVIPAGEGVETEITYTVAPKVKAPETTPSFDREWKFKSTAYYLENAKNWAANSNDAVRYIGTDTENYVDIEWDGTSKTDAAGLWRNKTHKYYWPKLGKLTFFAWTNVTASAFSDDGTGKGTYNAPTYTFGTFLSGVTVDNTNGVKVTDYDVITNKNVDLLVADIKADQTKNNASGTSPVYNTNGVPTLFKHKLSQVIFTAQTKDAYDYETKDNIIFTVNSIIFKGIDKVNTYTQGVTVSGNGAWGTASASEDQTYGSTLNQKVTTSIVGIYNAGNQYYYLPQAFTAIGDVTGTADYFVVDYTIKYANGRTETIEQKCILNNTESTKTIFEKWEMGKTYYIHLKFGLDEITWDPAVEDWTVGTGKDVEINPAV